MKFRNRRYWGTLPVLFLCFTLWPSAFTKAEAQVKIEVLDPRADLFTQPVQSIQPRLNALAGKKIAIMNNGKPGADAFQPYIEKALEAAIPGVQLRTWKIAYNMYVDKEKDLKAVAEWSDAAVGILGD